jgi:predicted transcriptional regulator
VPVSSKRRETMKIRKMHVIVKPWEEVWEKERQIARQLDRGERDPRWAQDTLYFISLEELRQVLTDRRLELLRLIHKERPDSIKALAALAGRDLKNVNADVHLLARLGFPDLAEEKAGPQRREPNHRGFLTLRFP